LRQYQKAEDDLLLAIAVRPNDPVLLNLLAYSWLQEEHNLEAAVGFLERAIQTKPNDSDIGDSLGWGYVKTGQIDKGVALLRQVIAARPELADAHAHLADGLRRLGRKAEALTALHSAEKYSQDNRLLVFIADQRRLMTD
jgi:tetratricopeptide (TPR) repeat protein